MLTSPVYAPLLFLLQLSPGFCALMKWLIYAVVMLSFVKTNTFNYLSPRVRLIFTEMEMLFCWHITCPYNLLNRYIQAAGIDFSSNLMFFRSLHFVKSNASYTLRSTGISYTRTREVVLHAFSQLGYSTKLFGLHSLRSGGATAAANAGVNDRLFKRHGRWRSDKAKDGYVKDNLEALLSVSKSLEI